MKVYYKFFKASGYSWIECGHGNSHIYDLILYKFIDVLLYYFHGNIERSLKSSFLMFSIVNNANITKCH